MTGALDVFGPSEYRKALMNLGGFLLIRSFMGAYSLALSSGFNGFETGPSIIIC